MLYCWQAGLTFATPGQAAILKRSARIRRWYNQDVSTVEYKDLESNSITAVFEVGLLNYECPLWEVIDTDVFSNLINQVYPIVQVSGILVFALL